MLMADALWVEYNGIIKIYFYSHSWLLRNISGNTHKNILFTCKLYILFIHAFIQSEFLGLVYVWIYVIHLYVSKSVYLYLSDASKEL